MGFQKSKNFQLKANSSKRAVPNKPWPEVGWRVEQRAADAEEEEEEERRRRGGRRQKSNNPNAEVRK